MKVEWSWVKWSERKNSVRIERLKKGKGFILRYELDWRFRTGTNSGLFIKQTFLYASLGIWNIIMGRVNRNTKWFSHFCYDVMTSFYSWTWRMIGLKTCPFKTQVILDLSCFPGSSSISSPLGLTMKSDLCNRLLPILSRWSGQFSCHSFMTPIRLLTFNLLRM